MSLLDSLLREGHRINVWVALRTDGIKGSGTIGDPYNGSSAARFDAVMQSLAAMTTSTVGVRVNLGPGTFETHGYYDGTTSGWQPSARIKIVGSGIDVTTLKVVGMSGTNRHYFAIGHALATSPSSQGVQVDFFENSDLTIDCGLTAGLPSGIAAGAIRIKGTHSRIRRVKAIGWGTNNASTPCFVISSIISDPEGKARTRFPDELGTSATIFDAVIEGCHVLSPSASTAGTVALLHVGGKSNQSDLPGENRVERCHS